ncbi:hypothetical protein ACIA5E_03215 [Nocardia asteroides]
MSLRTAEQQRPLPGQTTTNFSAGELIGFSDGARNPVVSIIG